MRIAVASEGLEVAPRFGQTTSYMCYTVDCGIIVECQNLPNPSIPVDKLITLFHEMEVDALIVGIIDYDIACLFCQESIEIIAKAEGSARTAAQRYLTRTLAGTDEMCHMADWEHESSTDKRPAEA